MKSYLLGIITVMLLSGVYAFQNTEEIVVRFFSLERAFTQGLWMIITFASGVVLMWFFSMLSAFETYRNNKNRTKELARRITELEDERKAFLKTLQNLVGVIEFPPELEHEPHVKSTGIAGKMEEKPNVKHQIPVSISVISPCEPEIIEPAENAAGLRKSALKSSLDSARSFLASLFPKKDNSPKETEPGEPVAVGPKEGQVAVCEVCGIEDTGSEKDAFREPPGCVIDDAVVMKEGGQEKKETFTV